MDTLLLSTRKVIRVATWPLQWLAERPLIAYPIWYAYLVLDPFASELGLPSFIEFLYRHFISEEGVFSEVMLFTILHALFSAISYLFASRSKGSRRVHAVFFFAAPFIGYMVPVALIILIMMLHGIAS